MLTVFFVNIFLIKFDLFHLFICLVFFLIANDISLTWRLLAWWNETEQCPVKPSAVCWMSTKVQPEQRLAWTLKDLYIVLKFLVLACKMANGQFWNSMQHGWMAFCFCVTEIRKNARFNGIVWFIFAAIVLIQSNSNDTNGTTDAVTSLRDMGVATFAVGIGGGVTEEYLRIIGSGCRHVTHLSQYADFEGFIPEIQRLVCTRKVYLIRL